MTDTELNLKLKNLASEERRLTRAVLEHIAEVERRKLYLRMAYGSLYEYLVREVGYSEGAAQRRIDAARVILSVPEVAEKVETGALNLGQIMKMRKLCREVRKECGKAVSVAKQKDVLQKLERRGARETDLILATEFQRKVRVEEKQTTQRDESVRVELTFTKEEMELLKAAQAALSNQAGGGLKETLLTLARKAVAMQHEKSTATVAVKTVTPKLRRVILQRDERRCQFKDSKTGRTCGATKFLEIDHIHPRFADGPTVPENLRVLCRNHNQFRYKVGL